MADNDLLKSFFEGSPPKNIRMLAAGGLVPVPQEDMIRLLVHLVTDPDQEVAQKATETLSSWAEKEIVSQLQSPQCSPEVLAHFAASASLPVQEAIILNPEAPGAVIARLASSVAAPLLETVLYNRMRLLATPEILQNIKINPAATAQILGLVQEIETEFFGSKKLAYTAEGPDAATPVAEEALELEAELAPEDLSLEGLPVDPQAREAAILSKINSMTVQQKIHLARMGTREARAVLIHDVNKEVSRTVLESPKLTMVEVEAFAAMRTVTEDILRQIGTSKAWTRSYAVVHNLVKNPKTPPWISQRMLARLHAKDLMLIARDRGISDAVRRLADRMLKQKNAP
ncbi:MAG: hypothetical protein LAP85_05775 [Acidobacteriia bacterium]|nr:hypothetical protein [Terriglobia bacterium]